MAIYIYIHIITLALRGRRGRRAGEGTRGIDPNRGPNRASPVNNHIWTDAVSNARLRSKRGSRRTRPDECQDFFLFWELNLRVDQV